ncbi:MAG: hypothetical protein QOF51_846 [Chloroflexota bacterium]|jgi:hypothetical protein|nr:hypothetical protein [Nocardioidaceae bacterium]MEA2639452.1 hypothetical protein [Chloroflexota bacterium]
MVSNVLDMTAQELVETLARFREQYADDPEYQEARAELPADWPL